MKITKTQLKQIIKEEMGDYDFDMGSAGGIPTHQAQNISDAMIYPIKKINPTLYSLKKSEKLLILLYLGFELKK